MPPLLPERGRLRLHPARLQQGLQPCALKRRRGPAPDARRLGKPWYDVVHRQAAELGILHIDDDLAFGEMRVGRSICNVVYRPNRRTGIAHDLQRLVMTVPGKPAAHGLVDQVPVSDAFGVGCEARILVHVCAADDLENPPCDLGRRA